MNPPAPPVQRQYVNFHFLKLDHAFRRLPEPDKKEAKAEFIKTMGEFSSRLMLLTYSTVGLRAETDILLWRISYVLEDFQDLSAALNKTRLGSYFSTPYSFLAMTKRSTYVDKINPEHQNQRTIIVPGKYKYLFVYPFLKTREWYLLPAETRQAMMDEHIRVGTKFPSVKLNTTYSFGLDDQEFVVAFETDSPADFLDLVMALRETTGSRYTLRDTPIFTAVHQPLDVLLDSLA
jgi:chlorite dismutase